MKTERSSQEFRQVGWWLLGRARGDGRVGLGRAQNSFIFEYFIIPMFE